MYVFDHIFMRKILIENVFANIVQFLVPVEQTAWCMVERDYCDNWMDKWNGYWPLEKQSNTFIFLGIISSGQQLLKSNVNRHKKGKTINSVELKLQTKN